jgi:hypothetical protein
MKKNNPVLIVEHCQSGLAPIQESTTITKSTSKYILGGTFTEFDIKNRNDRIYTAEKFLPHLDELLEKKKATGIIYGEFDHPDVFDTSLARVSHKVESLTFDQANNRIVGEIQLLSTHWGKEARALVDDDCPIFISSRAAGITESDGTVTLKKLFTYDAVADPGFSNAKMELKSMNESYGFNENVNFRLYDIADESKFNELIMENNNNQFVTKNEMVEYSNYLTEQIESVSKSLADKAKGEKEVQEILNMSELLENLQGQQEKVGKYLDYLANKVQFVITENEELKTKSSNLETTNERLVEYSNYLAENLDKNITYAEYLAENLEKNISYSEYIAENLDKSIEFSEYIAENVDKSIEFSDYLAENLEKTIDYSEYIAENLDKNICYSEYLAENLDKDIQYSEYLAENIDKNIAYSDYLAEHLDNNIRYSEYIAENVSDSQAYQNYLAESLDKTIEAVKGNKLFEGTEDVVDFKPNNVEQYYDDEPVANVVEPVETPAEEIAETPGEEAPVEAPVEAPTEELPVDGDIVEEPIAAVEEPSAEGIPTTLIGQPGSVGDQTGTVIADANEEGIIVLKLDKDGDLGTAGEEVEILEEKLTIITEEIETTETETTETETEEETETAEETETTEVEEDNTNIVIDNDVNISEQIQNLIEETKKRKVAEEDQPHFFEFLTEKSKQNFRDLSDDDKEQVKVAINESEYYSESDVLVIMNNALAVQKTFEESLIENMPEDLRPVYESLEDKFKTSLISQARMYPTLDTEVKMEAFWRSREMERYTKVKENKQVLNEAKMIDNSKLSDDQIDSFLGRMNS